VGRLRCATTPFRYASADRWLHSAAPTLGQHNREILGSVVGLSDAELDALEAEGVIGTQLEGL
jgi:crotonobetainyl-CoA:carnitine CoA-transferase CaiB-like acyl-CoA transferase